CARRGRERRIASAGREAPPLAPRLSVAQVIKYLGSKRRLVGVIADLAVASGAHTALDLFTGTTRVAQALKARGLHVTAVDSARYSEQLARCYVQTDAGAADHAALAAALARLDGLPGRPGYFTETFCESARYVQPFNGARVDAIRDAIASDHAGTPLEPLLLTSLLEATDRVDSTTGVQMAYLKTWAPRSHRRLELRAPALLPGAGAAVRGEAVALAPGLDPVGFAYLDPPYNQHSYYRNYHVWETLVALDAPAHYGVACKREDCRTPATRSAFNSKPAAAGALAAVLESVRAGVVVVSCSDEGWIGRDAVVELCTRRGEVAVLAFDSKRYVGAQIGIHDPAGRRVGRAGRLRNVEYLVLAGDPPAVGRMVASVSSASCATSPSLPSAATSPASSPA
ncbi:MAG: DNA adenine methylase, partial [Solirubrobacteraceae bacterium]